MRASPAFAHAHPYARPYSTKTTMATDPTAKKGASKADNLSPQEKIDSVLHLAKTIGSCMLVSSAPDNKLASRAMIPATTEGLVFSFFFNQESGKKDDM